MDEWEMTNVIARPDFHAGSSMKDYWPVPRLADPRDPVVGALDHKGVFFHPDRIKAMKALGFSDAEIEERFASYAQGKISSRYRE